MQTAIFSWQSPKGLYFVTLLFGLVYTNAPLVYISLFPLVCTVEMINFTAFRAFCYMLVIV